MLLETANLALRHYQAGDIELVAPILADPITMRFWPSPFTREAAEVWVARSLESYERHGFGHYPIVLRATGAVIGDCGIWRSSVAGLEVNDIGWIVHHPYWGRGYAPEAARAIADYAFGQLGLDMLHANMAWDNDPSRRVAEKLGMHKIDEFDNPRNRNIRTLLYALKRSE
jgi:RimJ/RimL family protein N-acetyltransferase